MVPIEKLEVIIADSLSSLPTPQEIEEIMTKKRIEKIPIINSRNEILGLATLRDI